MLPATHIEIAAVVIACQGRILAVHNARWGSFTIPMTKRRRWQDPAVLSGVREEEWSITATRAVAEVLGRTLPKEELRKSLSQVRQYKQSDIDGIWKLYDIEIFQFKVKEEPPLAPGVIAEWLTPGEFQAREPMSPTARFLLKELAKGKKLAIAS